jgi:hypothetical protein
MTYPEYIRFLEEFFQLTGVQQRKPKHIIGTIFLL